MAKSTGMTQAKRNRERARLDKQEEKRVERAIRKEQRKERATRPDSVEDPDLVGIVPGPQPVREH